MNTGIGRAAASQKLNFAKDCAGNVTMIFAVAFLAVSSAVGVAMDYSRASAVRARMQEALDAAVLAGAGDKTANRDTTAQNAFGANFVPKVPKVTSTPSFVDNGDGTYSATATATVPTAMLGIIGLSSISIKAQAKAAVEVIPPTGKALCIVSLNSTKASAINDSASSAVVAPNCIAQVNSNNTKAVTLSGSAQINTAENCFVGGLSTSGSAKVTPSPDAVCKAWTDPFASMPLPTVGACDHTNYKPTNNETLQPGVYCGGLNISSVNVTFAPGLYIIKDGLLQPSGGSTMKGDGVSFFLTGKSAGVSTSGSSAWHLSAMKTGLLAGFVFFLDPNATPAGKSALSGTSELYFEGVLYFARQQLDLSGGSAAFSAAPFTAYIADTYTLSGSSNLTINSDPTKTSVPIPSALLTSSTGSKLRLVM